MQTKTGNADLLSVSQVVDRHDAFDAEAVFEEVLPHDPGQEPCRSGRRDERRGSGSGSRDGQVGDRRLSHLARRREQDDVKGSRAVGCGDERGA